jgi:hypothetical protein
MTWRAAPATLMVMTTKSLLLTEFGQMGDEVPASLTALATLLARPSAI